MEYKFTSSIIVIALAMVIILVSGCATDGISHTNQLLVPFELVPSEDVYISRAYAYEDGDELVVYGKVKRSAQNCCDPARGHVDIAVLGPEGTVLYVTSTLYSPRNIPKVRSRTSRFTVRLPYTLPEGETIRIAYHSGLEALASAVHITGILECEQKIVMLNSED